MTVTDLPRPEQPRSPNIFNRARRALWRFVSEPNYRSQLGMRVLRPKGCFQPFNVTHANRYPVIFAFVQTRLAGIREPRLLSFGCSTGEEVFSLRRYFPDASIKGIDINPRNIRALQARLLRQPDHMISCEVANSTRREPAEAYDAIFCMAVLRDGRLGKQGVKRCDHLLRFDDFAAAIEGFWRCLKPGGLLVIRHSNFRLCDTPSAGKFETTLSVEIPDAARTVIFGPDNRLMEGVCYPDTVFCKTAHCGEP